MVTSMGTGWPKPAEMTNSVGTIILNNSGGSANRCHIFFTAWNKEYTIMMKLYRRHKATV